MEIIRLLREKIPNIDSLTSRRQIETVMELLQDPLETIDTLVKLWVLRRTNPFKYPKKRTFEKGQPLLSSMVKEIICVYGEQKVNDASNQRFSFQTSWMEWRMRCLIFIRNSVLGNDDERKTLSNWTDSYGGKSNARDERVEALIKAMEVSSIGPKADGNIKASSKPS